MTWLFKSRSAAIWLLLIVVTLFSWESAALSDKRDMVATGILVLAFFKVRMIGLEFMELRTAPLPLRIVFEVWVVGICAILLGLYWQVLV